MQQIWKFPSAILVRDPFLHHAKSCQPHKIEFRTEQVFYCFHALGAISQNKYFEDFPGGAVVKNPPANAGDTGSSPGPGRPHMPQSN